MNNPKSSVENPIRRIIRQREMGIKLGNLLRSNVKKNNIAEQNLSKNNDLLSINKKIDLSDILGKSNLVQTCQAKFSGLNPFGNEDQKDVSPKKTNKEKRQNISGFNFYKHEKSPQHNKTVSNEVYKNPYTEANLEPWVNDYNEDDAQLNKNFNANQVEAEKLVDSNKLPNLNCMHQTETDPNDRNSTLDRSNYANRTIKSASYNHGRYLKDEQIKNEAGLKHFQESNNNSQIEKLCVDMKSLEKDKQGGLSAIMNSKHFNTRNLKENEIMQIDIDELRNRVINDKVLMRKFISDQMNITQENGEDKGIVMQELKDKYINYVKQRISEKFSASGFPREKYYDDTVHRLTGKNQNYHSNNNCKFKGHTLRGMKAEKKNVLNLEIDKPERVNTLDLKIDRQERVNILDLKIDVLGKSELKAPKIKYDLDTSMAPTNHLHLNYFPKYSDNINLHEKTVPSFSSGQDESKVWSQTTKLKELDNKSLDTNNINLIKEIPEEESEINETDRSKRAYLFSNYKSNVTKSDQEKGYFRLAQKNPNITLPKKVSTSRTNLLVIEKEQPNIGYSTLNSVTPRIFPTKDLSKLNTRKCINMDVLSSSRNPYFMGPIKRVIADSKNQPSKKKQKVKLNSYKSQHDSTISELMKIHEKMGVSANNHNVSKKKNESLDCNYSAINGICFSKAGSQPRKNFYDLTSKRKANLSTLAQESGTLNLIEKTFINNHESQHAKKLGFLNRMISQKNDFLIKHFGVEYLDMHI